MSSEVIGPVLIVGLVVASSSGAMLWVAAQGPGLPASALLGVDDHPHDLDGDGVVDGHRVVVEAVSSTVEGSRVEIVVGEGSVRGPGQAVVGSGVFVPCGAPDHVQVVLWSSRVSGVHQREVAEQLTLGGCPGGSDTGDGYQGDPGGGPDGGDGGGGWDEDGCPWDLLSLDVEWALRCLLRDLNELR